MKKVFLLGLVFLQATLTFAQKEESNFYTTVPKNCKETLKEVITGFNNFKSCSQRAEMNQLLRKATSVVNECPTYFAENQDEFNKAKKHVEDTYQRLGCTNNGVSGQTNSNVNPFDQVGGILKDGAVNITQNSLADLQSTYQKEQELLKVLRGNETKYPQATQYFNEYLKEKKKRKTLQWIGLGGCIAGAVAVGAATLSIDEEGNFNEGLMYGGIGLTTVGLGVTIFSIKPSTKGKEALEKARSYVILGTTKNGIGFALNF